MLTDRSDGKRLTFGSASAAEQKQVPLKVNKLSSTKTLTPYEYYDVPFCRPPKRKGDMENLVRAHTCVAYASMGRRGMSRTMDHGGSLQYIVLDGLTRPTDIPDSSIYPIQSNHQNRGRFWRVMPSPTARTSWR